MISFIIPAHDEERLIGRTLSALHDAVSELGAAYEITVVEDASTDKTALIAQHHGARVVSVRLRHIAAARIAGAKKSGGDLLVFVDADTLVSAAVLRAALQAVAAGAVGGGARARFNGWVPVYGRVLERSWGWIQNLAVLASGGFIFCTRQAFDAIGGFDETVYIAEDVISSRQLKRLGKFVIVPEVVVTSGRTVRAHRAFDALRILAAFVLHGPASFTYRQATWYGTRSVDDEGLQDDTENEPGSNSRLTRACTRQAPGR